MLVTSWSDFWYPLKMSRYVFFKHKFAIAVCQVEILVYLFLNHLLIDLIMKTTQYFKDLKDKLNIAVHVGQQQYG